MRVKNEDLLELDNAAVSGDMSSSFNLKAVWLGHIANYAIQLVFTGSPQGNFKLQASNDVGNPTAQTEAERQAAIVNWTDIDDSAQTISAAGNHMWTVQNAGYNWVRVVWTQTGGSGTLTNAKCYVKGI